MITLSDMVKKLAPVLAKQGELLNRNAKKFNIAPNVDREKLTLCRRGVLILTNTEFRHRQISNIEAPK